MKRYADACPIRGTHTDSLVSQDPATDNVCFTFSWQTGTFANGTATPNGLYRFLLRTLRATGNPQKEEDYDAFLSPIFGVNGAQ